jgi:hypothetical protein
MPCPIPTQVFKNYTIPKVIQINDVIGQMSHTKINLKFVQNGSQLLVGSFLLIHIKFKAL